MYNWVCKQLRAFLLLAQVSNKGLSTGPSENPRKLDGFEKDRLTVCEGLLLKVLFDTEQVEVGRTLVVEAIRFYLLIVT